MNKNIHFTHLNRNEVYALLCEARTKPNVYAAYIRGQRCADYDSFFNEFSASLQFPDYFGSNWAAFDECLTDLEWLNISALVILIEDFRLVFADETAADRELLLKYLDIAARYWADEQKIPIEIYLNN